MKLWLLTRRSDKPVYDVSNGFVVRAETETEAREHAAQNCGDEGAETWRGVWGSNCEELAAEGEAMIVLQDFNAG